MLLRKTVLSPPDSAAGPCINHFQINSCVKGYCVVLLCLWTFNYRQFSHHPNHRPFMQFNGLVTSFILSVLQMTPCEQHTYILYCYFYIMGLLSLSDLHFKYKYMKEWSHLESQLAGWMWFSTISHIFFALNCLRFMDCEWFLFYVWWVGIHA